MSLDKTFNKLKLNLLRPFTFYVPKDLIPESKQDLWKGEKYQPYFNNAILIDHQGFDYELKEEPSFYEILHKQSNLDENLFVLLEKSGKLKSQQFQVLMDKYLLHLNFYVHVSQWMYNNIKLYIENASEETINSFKLQCDTFRKHYDQVLSDIYMVNNAEKPEPKMDVLEFVENNVSEYTEILSDTKGQETEPIPQQETKKKQAVILTEAEADDFLLRTVFHINTSKESKIK